MQKTCDRRSRRASLLCRRIHSATTTAKKAKHNDKRGEYGDERKYQQKNLLMNKMNKNGYF